MTKQQLFSKFNQVRREDGIDQVRLNRALGVVQKYNTPWVLKNYETSAEKCGCPDFIFRQQHVEGGRCKHQYALELMS
jgi:hypothetical protein